MSAPTWPPLARVEVLWSNRLWIQGELDRARAACGAAFRTRRSELGLSLRQVAKRVHCSPAFLSDMERGRRWSDLLAKTLAHLYEVQP